jgi:hypothetical protein
MFSDTYLSMGKGLLVSGKTLNYRESPTLAIPLPAHDKNIAASATSVMNNGLQLAMRRSKAALGRYRIPAAGTFTGSKFFEFNLPCRAVAYTQPEG